MSQKSRYPIPLSSIEKVFSIPELLELILLNLPTRCLLLSQRTSKTFKEVITSSPRLQQSLFFLPITRNDSSYNRNLNIPDILNGNEKPMINPLLYATFCPFFMTRFCCDPDFTKDDLEYWSDWADGVDWFDGEGKVTGKAVAFRRKEASWRRMMVCQPPVSLLEIERIGWENMEDHDKFEKASIRFRNLPDSSRSNPILQRSTNPPKDQSETLKSDVFKNTKETLRQDFLTMGELYDIVYKQLYCSSKLSKQWRFHIEWGMFKHQMDLNDHTEIENDDLVLASSNVPEGWSYWEHLPVREFLVVNRLILRFKKDRYVGWYNGEGENLYEKKEEKERLVDEELVFQSEDFREFEDGAVYWEDLTGNIDNEDGMWIHELFVYN